MRETGIRSRNESINTENILGLAAQSMWAREHLRAALELQGAAQLL